ncbi:LOW QUALITY PROTEIN: hypothetical protein M8C21_008705, partial [Ambrosia artemisiifolia]
PLKLWRPTKEGTVTPTSKSWNSETPKILYKILFALGWSPSFVQVRNDKPRDHVTVLQQVVLPFKKYYVISFVDKSNIHTDTTSALHEPIENIKLLHDQCTSYLSTFNLMRFCDVAELLKGGTDVDPKDRWGSTGVDINDNANVGYFKPAIRYYHFHLLLF